MISFGSNEHADISTGVRKYSPLILLTSSPHMLYRTKLSIYVVPIHSVVFAHYFCIIVECFTEILS